ncbi:tudor domain-containing protein 1 isoform X1 [Scleropages formosus]|uniref:tudor domain-containing protein 1 isoform X1 n=1 Tax=Scleropages formosus TaxID=113540 RepID=UPI0010FA8417|nr:tudor domain-containing protein 1 isoform X1 [Scleropages formosus]
MVKLCHYCGQQGSLRCARCKKKYYCSADCQARDWTAHRHLCKAVIPPVSASGMSQKHLAMPIRTSPRGLVAKESLGGGASPRRVYLSNMPRNKVTKGAQVEASVVELRNPGKFFIHMKMTVASLQRISAALQKVYSSVPEYIPECGEVCATRYSLDQDWYRGVVQTVDAPCRTAHIFYMDFGNEETVTLDRVKPLPPGVDLLPQCATECRMAGVTPVTGHWSEECNIAVRQMVVGKKLTMTVVDILDGGVCAVDILLTSGKELSSFLVEHGYAAMEPTGSTGPSVKDIEGMLTVVLEDLKSSGGKEETAEASLPSPLIHSLGDMFHAVVTHLESPDVVVCQKLENANVIQELQVNLHEFCSRTPAKEDFRPAPSSVCSSQFSEDSLWYRAKVLGYSSGDHVYVEYIDFGNTEEVDLSCLRPIPPVLLNIPIQAISCALSGVKPALPTWMDSAMTMLRSLVCNRILRVTVVGHREGTALVTLVDENSDPQMDVAEVLMASGYAVADDDNVTCGQAGGQVTTDSSGAIKPVVNTEWKYAELPADGQMLKLVVSMVKSPEEFYCRHGNTKDVYALAELSAALVQHCQSDDTAFAATVGQPCCALLPGDGTWGRALVQSMGTDKKVGVVFVDYGNTSYVDLAHLRAIHPKHLELPFQALRCRLAGVEPLEGQWSGEALQRFEALCLSSSLEARVRTVTQSGYEVELMRCGVSVASVLVSERLARPSAQSEAATTAVPLVATAAPAMTGCAFPTDWRTAELPRSEAFQAHVAVVVNPGLFYLVSTNEGNKEKLHALMGELANHCTSLQAVWSVAPEPGAACCAQFSGDKKWYRAVVLETMDSEASVLYSDYGNTERVPLSAICPIAREHLELPFRIIRCALEGLELCPPVWPRSVLRLFESMLKGSVVASVQGFDGTSYRLNLTSLTERGAMHVNTMVLRALEQMQSGFVTELSGSQVHSGGPVESSGSKKTESECPAEAAGKDVSKTQVEMERKEAEPQLNPEALHSSDRPSDVTPLTTPEAAQCSCCCCCVDLKRKMNKIEELLLLLTKQQPDAVTSSCYDV